MSFDPGAPFGDVLEGLRVDPVLFPQDPRGKRLRGVVFSNRDDRLSDDRPGVHSLIDEVHGAPREPRSVPDDLFVNMEAGEGGE